MATESASAAAMATAMAGRCHRVPGKTQPCAQKKNKKKTNIMMTMMGKRCHVVTNCRGTVPGEPASSRKSRPRRAVLGAMLPVAIVAGGSWRDIDEPAIAASNLSSIQRQAQQQQLIKFVKTTLLSEDASLTDELPSLMSLLLSDASGFDGATREGGVNGSALRSSSLPTNLKSVAERVERVRASVETKSGIGGRFGSGDTLVLVTRVAVQELWRREKIARAETPEGGELIVAGFSASFPVKIGRIDADAGPTGELLTSSTSVADARSILSALGVKKGRRLFTERQQFLLWPLVIGGDLAEAEASMVAADSVYDEWMRKYQKSRRTVTRTDYEVDFIDAFTKIAGLAAFDPDAYLVDREPVDLSKLKL